MRLLADENVTTEWVGALRGDGHDVARVVDDLGPGASDLDVLALASRLDRTLLTADRADFTDPPVVDHPGVLVVADDAMTDGELRRAVRRIAGATDDIAGATAFVDDWL